MPRIALKIDVDTYRGTLEGAGRLADLLERLGIRATFLFSLGPDHSGRAIRRVFRRGFLGKVRRTSVLRHYGLKTLLYGTLLPGPHIGKRCADTMRRISARGFETGIHTYDHVRWQDGVARASEAWTLRQMQLAQQQFVAIFGIPARIHGAAGWQLNRYVPAIERQMGFRFASDVRGTGPFVPMTQTGEIGVPQLPTTLPTMDELIGREDLAGIHPVDFLLSQTDAFPHAHHVLTLHAEIEGGAYLGVFERLLTGWRARNFDIGDLSDLFATLDIARLPRHRIITASVPGRSGTLACQAANAAEDGWGTRIRT